MIFFSANGYQIWGKTLPASVSCEDCEHPYHVLNDDRSLFLAFPTFTLARDKFQELSGTSVNSFLVNRKDR